MFAIDDVQPVERLPRAIRRAASEDAIGRKLAQHSREAGAAGDLEGKRQCRRDRCGLGCKRLNATLPGSSRRQRGFGRGDASGGGAALEGPQPGLVSRQAQPARQWPPSEAAGRIAQ